MKYLKFKILKWLMIKTQEQYKVEYLKVGGVDILCPNCNEWYSVSSIKYKHKLTDAVDGYTFTCGQCQHSSNWNTCDFPYPALCDETWEVV